jgi:hypothetical protein
MTEVRGICPICGGESEEMLNEGVIEAECARCDYHEEWGVVSHGEN